LGNIDERAVTVFIAEDNPILLQGLGRALSANGYVVETAEDGSSMLSLLAEAAHPPDLLLLDVMMPGLSGFDVMQQLRADERWADLPVVLITAATDEAFPVSAMRSGAADVLIKPFRLSELLERIDLHVRHYRERLRSRASST
jgi:DNA-binding response OmpR family regulator